NGAYKGVRILKPESVAKMREDQTTPAIRGAGLFFPGPGMGFGLGGSVVIDDKVARPGNGTYSWWGIAGTEFWVDPTNDLFMVLMTKTRGGGRESQRKTRAWIYDALVKPPAPDASKAR